MTWQEFCELVEADGIMPETRLASVHWTARTGLVVQPMPMTAEAPNEGDLAGGTVMDSESPEAVYTKRNELGEVGIHD
jgi:hypothetical protein